MANSTELNETKKIEILDPLRGFAALSVCIYHLVCGNESYLPKDDPLKLLASFGHLGVPVFFVISGFVICHSLGRRDYKINDAGHFLLRRLKRLEPPYLAAVLVSIAVAFLAACAPGFNGPPPSYEFNQLIAHVGYLVDIAGFDWINPVFWTLALEFLFYLLMALVFPLLNAQSRTYTFFAICSLMLLFFAALGNRSIVFYWMPLFSIGIICWASTTNRLTLGSKFAAYIIAGGLVFYGGGLPNAIASLGAAAIISIYRPKVLPTILRIPAWLGTISYSLYLLHVPFGARITNLSTRLPNEISIRYLAVLIAVVFSIFVSWLFWRLIEKPAAHWSQSRTTRKITTYHS